MSITQIPKSYQKEYTDWFLGKTDKPPLISEYFDVSKIPVNDELMSYVGTAHAKEAPGELV